ncbi:uncharacterized protein EI90DRAFT_1256333 [Cantharellus anzutake]|uniref:uncharacterized protein n=1 Tax=Cantharellus anzutake TaxID=1750568 RepID=UPI001902C753|nr:uncharacterized protein EI90DRAFT_1256333 [Cantharellus anzutake]KAF8329993.1 hypothetical protein EI90DRAFT_1256333 [Cantharellus anzutake]
MPVIFWTEATSESPDISNDVNGHQRSPNYRSGFSSLRENSDPMLITGVTSSTTLSSHVAHVVSREHLASLSVDLDVASPELKLPPTRPSDSEKKPRELSGLYPTPPLLTRTDTYTMDHKNKRKRSSTEFEPRTPKRPSTILSVSNQEQSSALSSLLHLPQLDFTSWLAPDFGFHDWHSEPYVGIHGAAGTSGDSALNSVTTLLGPSHSHSDPYTPPPSRQALPTDLLTLQTPTPDDTPHHHVPPWSLLGDRRLWPSGRSSISHSSTRVSESPVPISFVHSARLLSPPSAPSLPETAYASPNPWTPYDNRARVRTQLENAGMNFPVPPVSEPTPSSSVGPSDGIEGSIISTTRLILHTASIALKFSPISFLPKIPDLLLTLLQVYESVTGNNEALKRLNDDVQNVYSIMLRPLQLWTGPVPPQISFLVNQLHLALEDQVKKIKSPMSQNQNLFRKISTADSLTQSINDVRMHISVALSRFATAATTLNLLNTIQASVDYELSKLPRADAEWYRVKSKSECPETTRDQTRSSILNRLRDPENRFVWLRGSPGTGKTVISMGVASTLDKQHTLASSFFWDKNQRGTGLDSIERFPSTLARQLAAFNAEYKSLLIRQLRESASFSSIGGSAAEKEMAAWIINPMRELGGVLSSGKGRPVIVLDGLDECGNPEVLVSLMRLVLLLDKLPPMFAILVSCRPEPQVISAWAQANPHLSIAHEDMDQMAEDENFHTIRCMVENGLQDCIMESPWKPTEKDLDGFASACRGLPLIASTRIRDVVLQIECGSVLETEFDYYRNLIDAPQDLNWEYLRIMRRAYLQQRPEIDPHITEKYREVVGMMVVPRWAFGVYGISQLLGMFSEHEVRAILKPISSIVDMPSTNEMPVKFYHATVKEFITGIPIGKGEDKVFFINDKNGYSIGLRLLRFVNGAIKRNELGLPTELPLGDEKKWESKSKTSKPKHVDYALAHLFRHLNPSLLFSQESNGLQREFEQFWTQNLFSFFSAGSEADVPRVWNQFKNHKSKSISVVRAARDIFKWRTRPDVYRSVLPFTPTSSLVYELYGHLSDPVRVFSVSGKFAGGLIPLSDDAHSARRVMEAELTKLPGAVDEQQKEGIDYGAEFINDSVRNGIVTCAALSRDGHLVALGFGSGIIEVADINNQATICRFQSDSSYPPVWIEFIHSSNAYIATEDTQGNVTIFSHEMPMVKLGILPSTTHPPVTTVSGDGSFIARVPSNSEGDWYETTALLRVSGNSFIQLLMPPSTTQSLKPSSLPLRHTLGFSPGGRYFSAYDKNGAFIWSTDSGELITRFGMGGFDKWIINVGIAPSCSYSTPSPIFLQHSVPLIPEDYPQ